MTANLQTVQEIVRRTEERSKEIDASLKVTAERFEQSLQELQDAVAAIGTERRRRR